MPPISASCMPHAMASPFGNPITRPVSDGMTTAPIEPELVSTLLTGGPIGWSVKKGAAWWLHDRIRDGRREVVLRTVLNPDML